VLTLWRLVHARAVCGLIVRDGVVVEAAPYKGSRWPDVRADLLSPRMTRRAYSSEARRGEPLNVVGPAFRGSRVLTRGRAPLYCSGTIARTEPLSSQRRGER
jgi:hypothetical protein